MTDEMTVEEVPRRWWQKRRACATCPCGWRSAPVVVDRYGLSDLKLTFDWVDHRRSTGYGCGGVA
jgi:hypothetical protein